MNNDLDSRVCLKASLQKEGAAIKAMDLDMAQKELPQQGDSKSLCARGSSAHTRGQSEPVAMQQADSVVQPILGRVPCVSFHLLQQVSSLQCRAWLLLLHCQQHHVQAGLAGLLGSVALAACRPGRQASSVRSGGVMEAQIVGKALMTWHEQWCAGPRQTDALCQQGPGSLQVLDR